MGLPLAPLIAGGASIIGQALSGLFTGKQNRASQQFSRDMYNQQRADNIGFWNMQNEYNAPVNQMKRLQEAGLNPALMYGKSASPGVAGSISTPDVQSAQFRTPNVDAMAVMDAFFNTEIKQAQVDNLRADNTVKLEEAMLKNTQRKSVEQTTARSKFDLDLDSELRSISADVRRENLRALKASTRMTLNEDERKSALNAASLRESVERVLNLKADRTNKRAELGRIRAAANSIRKDGVLKQLDIDLKKNGIQPTDPMYMRILTRIIDHYFGKDPWFKKR